MQPTVADGRPLRGLPLAPAAERRYVGRKFLGSAPELPDAGDLITSADALMAGLLIFSVLPAATAVVVIATVVAVVASVRRRWSVARRAARLALIVVAVQLGVGVLAMFAAPLLLRTFGTSRDPLVGVDVDPSQRARVLAQGISEWMNTSAFGLLFALGALPLWLVARRRERNEPPPAPLS